jgi:hypothetical protein
MSRGKTDLSSSDYDAFLASRAQTSRSARQELEQRHNERRNAHDGQGIGYHFGLGDKPVKITSEEHLKVELDKRGLMLKHEVKKNLR